MSAGNTMSVLRGAVDLSLRELAGRAGVNPGYLSQVERGVVEPSQRWVDKITAALGSRLAESGQALGRRIEV